MALSLRTLDSRQCRAGSPALVSLGQRPGPREHEKPGTNRSGRRRGGAARMVPPLVCYKDKHEQAGSTARHPDSPRRLHTKITATSKLATPGATANRRANQEQRTPQTHIHAIHQHQQTYASHGTHTCTQAHMPDRPPTYPETSMPRHMRPDQGQHPQLQGAAWGQGVLPPSRLRPPTHQ